MLEKTRKLVLWYPRPVSRKWEGVSGEFEYPPLGLGIIAALTPPHWQVVIRDANFDEVLYEECDLVGISAMTSQALNAYKISEIFRRRGKKVVLGGIHPTVCWEEAADHADCVVKGEAEAVWGKVLHDFENGTLQKIYEGDLVSLDKVPAPSIHLYNPRYKWGIISTARGCPFACEYCSVTAFNGGTYRKRPIANVLDELEQNPKKFIFFADDNMCGCSIGDHQRFLELCRGMIARKIKKMWVSQVSVHFSDNEELMKTARLSGCIGVLIGIESAQKEVLQGKMGKRFNVTYIEKGNFVKKIRKTGIGVLGSFIVGNDEDTLESFDALHDLIIHLGIDVPMISKLTVYPGTKLWKRLSDEKRIRHREFPQDWQYYNGLLPILFDLKNMTDDEFIDGFTRLRRRVFSWQEAWVRILKSLWASKNIHTCLKVFYLNAMMIKEERAMKYKKNEAGEYISV